MNWSLGERLRVENAGTKEKKEREKKNIYYFNERDNKIYYLILTFELPCTAINSCTLQLSR